MNRRKMLAFLTAAPAVLAAACRPEPVAAQEPLSFAMLDRDHDFSRVGSKAWYVQRLYDNAADGNAICTRDNGALFEFCRNMSELGMMGTPQSFANLRNPITGEDPVTNTRHYIYWSMPRKRLDREFVLMDLKAAAWRDDSFGVNRRDTFVQPSMVLA